jgi:hypothetical protein
MGKPTKSDGDADGEGKGKKKGPKPPSLATVLRPVCIGAVVLMVVSTVLPKVL